ncbi:MAG: hypothetical protein PHX21_12800 [bacterium]|nr:hypothetical protein [bacterium]
MNILILFLLNIGVRPGLSMPDTVISWKYIGSHWCFITKNGIVTDTVWANSDTLANDTTGGSIDTTIIEQTKSGKLNVKSGLKIGWLNSYTNQDSSGFQWATGNARSYEDVRVAGLGMRTNATAPDLIPFAPAITNLLAYGFDGTITAEQAYFAIQMPHSYAESTSIYPHVHWAGALTDTGKIKWQIEYTWASIESNFVAPSTISAIDTMDVIWKHEVCYFPAITGSNNKTISSMIMCRIFRNPADASDTYQGDAALLEVDFHFIQNTMGSRTEKVK